MDDIATKIKARQASLERAKAMHVQKLAQLDAERGEIALLIERLQGGIIECDQLLPILTGEPAKKETPDG